MTNTHTHTQTSFAQGNSGSGAFYSEPYTGELFLAGILRGAYEDGKGPPLAFSKPNDALILVLNFAKFDWIYSTRKETFVTMSNDPDEVDTHRKILARVRQFENEEFTPWSVDPLIHTDFKSLTDGCVYSLFSF